MHHPNVLPMRRTLQQRSDSECMASYTRRSGVGEPEGPPLKVGHLCHVVLLSSFERELKASPDCIFTELLRGRHELNLGFWKCIQPLMIGAYH